MTLVLLAVPLILTFVNTEAKITASLETSECDDCNENEPWRPLFKPSQIIHSEFPEHAQYKSQEQRQYSSREHGPQYASHEGSQYNSLEQTALHPSGPSVDSRVRAYSSQGRHRVEWDHYGDVSHVTTASYQSLEDRGGDFIPVGSKTPPNSLEVARVSKEDHSKEPEKQAKVSSQQDVSANSEDGSFFSEGSFFDESFTSPKDNFQRDFDISKDSSFSDEVQSSNSIEPMNSHEGLGRYRSPVATSYSSMSSVFAGARPVHPQPRDLRHELLYKDITKYIQSRLQHPVSQTQFFNGGNVTKQYLVHEPQTEDPGTLVINHTKGRSSSPGPYVPMNHPVYRYVKTHGGLTHQYRRQPLRWQDIHPELRNKFPFKHLQPYVRVQNHETVIRHVIPTKDPFSDSFWKESKHIEDLKPPPLGQTLYFFKKKPKPLDFNSLRRRQGHHNYVYIIKTNKRLS